MINVDIINECTVLTDDQIKAIIPALQQQVTQDYYPAWGTDATIQFVAKGTAVDPTHWQMAILDDSDQAGALGYHDITASGQPLAKVFAKSDVQYNMSWSVTISHELLEMLTDPFIDYTVLTVDDRGDCVNYALEVCDACEDDQFAYKIGDVLVSDFVLPSWFESFRAPGSVPFDFKQHISSPFALISGGYIGILKSNSGTGWTQVTAEKVPTSIRYRGAVGSRRERRRTPKYQWLYSTK